MSTRVITAPTVEPITLAEAKLHLKEDLVDASNDARISACLSAARQAVEHDMGRSIMLQSLKNTLDEFADVIELPAPPVIDITSVIYTNTAGAAITLDPSAYVLDAASEPARLVPAYGTSWPATQASPGAVRVTYRAGYSNSATVATAQAAVPAGIKHAILLELGSRYKFGAADDANPAVRHDFARHLLDPFRVYAL